MGSNFYYNIYSKKTSEELRSIIKDSNSEKDTVEIAIDILADRNELTDEDKKLKEDLKTDRELIRTIDSSNKKYQTISPRILAMIIDGIIISLLSSVQILFRNVNSEITTNIISAFVIFLPYAYSIILHGLTGQTIGKSVMNIKVFDKDERIKINFKQAFLRDSIPFMMVLISYLIVIFDLITSSKMIVFTSFLFSFLMLFWMIIELVTMTFNKRKRAIHDFIAGSVVIRIKDK